MIILYYIVLGFAVGIASGLLGTGGGVLLVPALIWFFGFKHEMALGTTLAIMVPPIGLLAALEYYRQGHVHVQAAVYIAAAFIIGAYAGARLVPEIPVDLLRFLFGLMLMFIAVRFMLASDREVASAFLGLLAVVLAWLGFIGLRALGRRHLPRPNLGAKIRELEQPDRTGDYHI